MRFKWREDTGFRLLALFLALILWVYVTHQRNPVLERVVRVPLGQEGLAADMIIQDMPGEVTVYYRSSGDAPALVDSDEFTAMVNLADVDAGRHSLPVHVRAPAGIEVIRVSPQRVTVSLDSIKEKTLSVAVNVLGTPAPGYKRLDPVVTPPVVRAVGPGELLQEIDKVAVSINIKGATTGIEQVVPVSTGIKDIELQPDAVKVTVPVESLPSRSFSVEPGIEGEPAAEFRVESVVVEPDTVDVTGTQESIDSITGLQTEPLDISGAVSDVTADVNVVIPPGISKVTPEQVRVTVKIVPQEPEDRGDEQEPVQEPVEEESGQ